MEKPQIAFLIILWYIAGTFIGHATAKYARAKKITRILAGVFVLLGFIFTYYFMR
jgi:hypothetical protein